MDELRAVARFVTEAAESVLSRFEEAAPNDPRPQAAIAAAREFIDGAARSKSQRVASLDAHRAAKDAPDEISRLAAQAAGDAASAAYLHPIAKATQVGHILRAHANLALIAQIDAGGNPGAATVKLDEVCDQAPSNVVDILRRYPPAPNGRILFHSSWRDWTPSYEPDTQTEQRPCIPWVPLCSQCSGSLG